MCECVAAALKMCSFSGFRSSFLRPDRDVHAGMDLVQAIRGLLAWIGDANSVKTLVRRSPGLPDLRIGMCAL